MMTYTKNQVRTVLRKAYALGYRHGRDGEPHTWPKVSELVDHAMTGNFSTEKEVTDDDEPKPQRP